MVIEKKKIQVIVNCEESNLQREELEQMGTLKYALPMINAYVIEIYEENIGQLEGLRGVVKVEQDAHLTAQMNIAKATIHAQSTLDTSANGENITVAILDTGIYPHNDFMKNKDRIIAFKDFINDLEAPYDDNGHGTHVAGIIGGDGYESEGKYAGVAPQCNLVAIKVLNKDGTGNISDVLAGIQWILDYKDKYNIRVMNLSVGTEDIEGENAALVKGVDVAWDNGIVVVCAAGNNGPKKSSITTPGVSRKVITVGSSDDALPVKLMSNFTSNYSSRGPTKSCIKKPDVVAPGSNIFSCHCKTDYRPDGTTPFSDKIGYIKKSGTSMSAPVVTGAIVRLLSDYPDISNRDIKLSLKYSTQDLGYNQEHQGWGLFDLKRMYDRVQSNKVDQ